MFSYIKGILTYKEPTNCTLDVHGIGFEIHITLSTYENLPIIGKEVKLLIHHYVREDAQRLYGFFTFEEKELFLLLISISGIGAKMALTILSGATPDQFKNRIISEDVKSLTLIPGIGKKTAQRIIIELGEKLTQLSGTSSDEMSITAKYPNTEEALRALISLGYNRAESTKAINKALKEIGNNGSLEQYIKIALNKM